MIGEWFCGAARLISKNPGDSCALINFIKKISDRLKKTFQFCIFNP